LAGRGGVAAAARALARWQSRAVYQRVCVYTKGGGEAGGLTPPTTFCGDHMLSLPHFFFAALGKYIGCFLEVFAHELNDKTGVRAPIPNINKNTAADYRQFYNFFRNIFIRPATLFVFLKN